MIPNTQSAKVKNRQMDYIKMVFLERKWFYYPVNWNSKWLLINYIKSRPLICSAKPVWSCTAHIQIFQLLSIFQPVWSHCPYTNLPPAFHLPALLVFFSFSENYRLFPNCVYYFCSPHERKLFIHSKLLFLSCNSVINIIYRYLLNVYLLGISRNQFSTTQL